MKIGHYWNRLRTLPPGEVVRRARNKAQDRVNLVLSRWRGYRSPTYHTRYPAWLSAGMSRQFPASANPHSANAGILATCRLLSEHFLAHRFNLLGSGWVEVRRPESHGTGSINAANRAEATRIQSLIRMDYAPIDWQADFKSGHRWPSETWHTDMVFGSTPGVDVKVPWELARMQHLPQFAWAFATSASGQPEQAGIAAPAETYRAEFRDQVLDFIANNPPGFGVNWVCTMDVAIRVTNWIVARDLFLSLGATFDPGFETVFARSVYEHGKHIIGNLEWSPGMRGNHYYADIAGLAVVAASLPQAPETDAWLAFAVREILAETEIQFLPDGGNFEASTCYHRLSAEMAAYATALVLSLSQARLKELLAAPPEHARYLPRFFRYWTLTSHIYPGWGPLPFPPVYFERLERAAEFTVAITRPDGQVPQFGDNDSGRFLKLFPTLRPGSNAEEDFLDHRHVVAALNGFFGRRDLEAFAGEAKVETEIVASLLGGRTFPSYSKTGAAHPGAGGGDYAALSTQPARYPDFGLYIFRKPGFYLAFRCGPIGQLGNGGHAHNDQLSFELALGGVSFLEDPGTFLYTPDWQSRNQFRSTASHNTLGIAGLEQDPWENTRPGLFSLISRSRAETVEIDEMHVTGRHQGFGAAHKRMLKMGEGRVEGTDWCEQAGVKSLAFHFAPEVKVSLSKNGGTVEALRSGITLRIRSEIGTWSLKDGSTSSAYGESHGAQVAILDIGGETQVKWYIEWSGC